MHIAFIISTIPQQPVGLLRLKADVELLILVLPQIFFRQLTEVIGDPGISIKHQHLFGANGWEDGQIRRGGRSRDSRWVQP